MLKNISSSTANLSSSKYYNYLGEEKTHYFKSPKFGHYKLTFLNNYLQKFISNIPVNFISKLFVSLLKKLILKQDKYDIASYENCKLRLSPFDNRCEKKVFFTPLAWDEKERKFIENTINNFSNNFSNSPFVFIDLGANVGMYSICTELYCKKHNINTYKIIAIEPDKENLQRLLFNQHINNLSAKVINCAVGEKETIVTLKNDSNNNRGEIAINQKNHVGTIENNNKINMIPLESVIKLLHIQLDKIDILKIDIEGHETNALLPFFTNVCQSLWPQFIILECGRNKDNPALNQCLQRNYQALFYTKLNVILQKN